MATLSWVGARFALGASAGGPLLMRRIARRATIGIVGALRQAALQVGDPGLQRLDPDFQLPDGHLQLLDDLQQLQDQLAHDEWGRLPPERIKRSSCSRWRRGDHRTPSRVMLSAVFCEVDAAPMERSR